jgi:hypothetical protein
MRPATRVLDPSGEIMYPSVPLHAVAQIPNLLEYFLVRKFPLKLSKRSQTVPYYPDALIRPRAPNLEAECLQPLQVIFNIDYFTIRRNC